VDKHYVTASVSLQHHKRRANNITFAVANTSLKEKRAEHNAKLNKQKEGGKPKQAFRLFVTEND
jgi:hypothetical protein